MAATTHIKTTYLEAQFCYLAEPQLLCNGKELAQFCRAADASSGPCVGKTLPSATCSGLRQQDWVLHCRSGQRHFARESHRGTAESNQCGRGEQGVQLCAKCHKGIHCQIVSLCTQSGKYSELCTQL